MSLPADRHLLPATRRALLARLVLKTDERSRGSRSKTDQADAGLLLWATSEHLRPADTRHFCMHRVHHVQAGADDVTGLLIAALAASTHHADRP